DAQKLSSVLFGVALLIGVISAAAAAYAAQQMVIPVRALAVAADRIGDGDLRVRVGAIGTNEFGRFAAAFNTIMQALVAERQHGTLQQKQLQTFADTQDVLRSTADASAAQARAAAALVTSVLQAATDYSIIATDIRGIITLFNYGAERMLGYAAGEIIGMATPAALHIAAELDQRAEQLGAGRGFEALVAAARRGGAETREWTYVKKNGTTLTVALTVSAIRSMDGQLTGFIFVGRDITESKRAQLRLAAQHSVTQVLAQATTLADAAPGILRAVLDGLHWELGEIWGVDPQAGVLRCIEIWRQPGASLDEFEASSRRTTFVKGRGLPGQVWAGRSAVWVRDMRADPAFRQGGIADRAGLRVAFGCPIVLNDEVYGVIEFFGSEVREPDEALVQLVSTIGNQIGQFLERTRAVGELRRQYVEADRARSEARAILDAARDTMVLISPDLRVLSVNRRFSDLFFGGSSFPVVNHPYSDLERELERILDDSAGLHRMIVETAADPKMQFTRTVRQVWPEQRELELVSTPVQGAGGAHLGRLFVFHDVTREREVDRMKNEFISLVSHELRTPLTSIKGYVDLLVDGELGDLLPEQREFLQIVLNNADRLVKLINELLDISRIESGRVELHLGPLDPGVLLRDVAESLHPLLSAKGQRLTVKVAPRMPQLLADRDRVAQIVTNLLSNAHKYTPPGGEVVLSARIAGSALRVEVEDTGIGMTAEEQEQLFTKFFRAKNRTTQEVGGTGLGLAITKALVEMHGGTMSVTSEPGRGSTFGFSLPLVPPSQSVRELAPREAEPQGAAS
ncbi:MAG: ATP-binding protein, partial [Chloroflexi bacterium]|nr:ATP-binding protein [Chloroflexota bacterium]